MQRIIKQMALGLALVFILTCGSGLLALASDEPTGNRQEGNWVYEVVDGEAAIRWGAGAEKSWRVLMLPAELGGCPVTSLGGSGTALSNNNAGGYVLFPEGIETICAGAVYDYNTTLGWSFPASLSSLDESWCASIKPDAVFYASEASPAAAYAASHGQFTLSGDTKDFTAAAGEGGSLLPNGDYHLPTVMLDESFSAEFTATADSGFTIASLTVDGVEVSAAAGTQEYTFDYIFSVDSVSVTVTFSASASNEASEENAEYIAPAILPDAVAPGAALPADVNDFVCVSGSETSRYENTMGVSTGSYYAADGKFYEQIASYTSSDEEPMFSSKAEVVNYAFAEDGLVFGADYSLIRLYNYHEFVRGGPRGGDDTYWNCAYLYRETEQADGLEAVVGSYEDSLGASSEINHDSLFVQEDGSVSLSNFHAQSYTAGQGPQEAGNFFGLASGIQVDGGDVGTAAVGKLNAGNTDLVLIDPTIDGAANSIYAAANGRAWLYGGLIFSCSSGGHGPYVSTGGEIFLNIRPGDGFMLADGTLNRDGESLAPLAQPIPDSSLAVMEREEPDQEIFTNDNEMRGYRTDEENRDAAVSVIVTGDEAGTTLATDTGGGVIAANSVVTKAFGNGSGGVYSIGSDESWVYVYNSSLNSYLDAGLVSASGGYVFAYNCDIRGVAGIKARSGGSQNAVDSGVHVFNSRVTAVYDDEEMDRVYEVSTPKEFWAQGDMDYWQDYAMQGMENKAMNMFVLKAQMQVNTAALGYWFEDRDSTPVTGNKFAVIYIDGASTPIEVDSSFLYNANYDRFREEGASNWLITAENAASGLVTFRHENSRTHWNVLDEQSETCELTGDIWIASELSNSDPGMASVEMDTEKPAALSVELVDSEWTGSVKGYGQGFSLSMDDTSVWTVTEDCEVGSLEIADGAIITADHPVTIRYHASSTALSGTTGNVTFVFSED